MLCFLDKTESWGDGSIAVVARIVRNEHTDCTTVDKKIIPPFNAWHEPLPIRPDDYLSTYGCAQQRFTYCTIHYLLLITIISCALVTSTFHRKMVRGIDFSSAPNMHISERLDDTAIVISSALL